MIDKIIINYPIRLLICFVFKLLLLSRMLIRFSLSPSKGVNDIIIRPKNGWVNRARLIVDKQFLLSIRRQLFSGPGNKNTKTVSSTKHYANKFLPLRYFINRVITVVISDFSRGRIRRLLHVIARRSQVPDHLVFVWTDRSTDAQNLLGFFSAFPSERLITDTGHVFVGSDVYTLTIIYVMHLGIMIIIIII